MENNQTTKSVQTKKSEKSNAEEANSAEKELLARVVSVRLAPADAELLATVAAGYPLARRGAVAREALRRGLELLAAEGGAEKD